MSESSQSKPGAGRELTGKIGRYQIVRPLGKGAMGVVYLAHDPLLERDVALKVMVAQIADDPELSKRFEREAKAVARMTHPNVVTVYDLGYHEDGSPYIAMELLKGQDLSKAVRATPPLSLERKVAIIVQVLTGLGHAHQAGIVHRDIKPANVFINVDGTVKIMDFGVARLTTASMTGTGNIIGTADYMSPEQVKGARVDGRSDLFSAGCLLYELLTGRRPFHADNLMAIFYKITHEDVNYDLVPSGPGYGALLPILRRALAKELADRYQSAYEFGTDLREYLKARAAAGGDAHALEGLLDMDAPGTAPAHLLGESPGVRTRPPVPPTVSGAAATVHVAGGRPGTGSATGTGKALGPTVVAGAPTVRSGAEETYVEAPAPRTAPRRPPGGRTGARPLPAPEPSRAGLWYAAGGVAIATAAFGAYQFLGPRAAPPITAPATTLAAAPPATVPALATPAPPPPTPVPQPTFEAAGRSAASMRAAQVAFRRGDYDRALSEAQSALKQDPSSADARRLLESALNGQKASTRARTAADALRAGDHARASAEAEAARALAPWDSGVTDLLSRIRAAEARAQQEAQQRAQREEQQRAERDAQQQRQALAAGVNKLLAEGDQALAAQDYDAAIAAYGKALEVDPASQRAVQGRTGAITARAIAQAQAGAGARTAGRIFVAAKTTATSAETRAGSLPAGFESSPGVTVKQATQAADLPGRILFDVSPDTVKAGDRYVVKIFFLNEGQAPIQIREMIVGTKINNRGAQGPVPPLAKDVAPQQRALLRELPDLWKEDTASWSMEVVVRTTRGETYRNQVSWK
jgi:tetratricopeptide (TPR) repeat protein